MSAIVKIYGNNVLRGKKSFDEVPDKAKNEVKEYILSIDPEFFGTEEDNTPKEPEQPSENEGEDKPPVSGSDVGSGSDEPTETPKSIIELYNNAKAGDILVLEKDEDLDDALVIEKDVVINLNGKTLRSKKDVFKVKSNLDINGNGVVRAGTEAGDNVAVYVYTNGNVTINGGEYSVGADSQGSGNTTIYINGKGNCAINGGKFSTDVPYNNKYYVLNINNSATGKFIVKGGTFVNYNPTNGDDVLKGSFIADGYQSVDNGDGTYTVSMIEENTAE